MNELNFQENLSLGWDWAYNNKTKQGFSGATALAGYLILEILKQLNLKFENKPHNYEIAMKLSEEFLNRHENSTDIMTMTTTTFLNSGLDILYKINKKIEAKENNGDSDNFMKQLISWGHEIEKFDSKNTGNQKSFTIIINALDSFNEKVNNYLNITSDDTINIKTQLLKKYRSKL